MGFQPHGFSGAQDQDERIGPALAQVLGRLGGIAVLDASGAVLSMDAQARSLLTLEGDPGADAPDGADQALLAQTRSLQALLARACERHGAAVEGWRMVARHEARPLLLQAVPLAQGGTLLILLDLQRPVATNPAVLERVFGLTGAEARLAALLAGGASPAEAAGTQGVSLATVRKQLAAIFSKTRTRGQVELVALVSRLACLP